MSANNSLALKEPSEEGGASDNDLPVPIQANMLGVPLPRSRSSATTVPGVPLRGPATGYWLDAKDLCSQCQKNQCFCHKDKYSKEPTMWRVGKRLTLVRVLGLRVEAVP